jgi:uncharacterized protein
MRWSMGRRSTNVEDRRGLRVSRGAGGGGLGLIVMALVAMYFGVDPRVFLEQVDTGPATTHEVPYQASPEEEQLKEFVSVVLADTEDVWRELFEQMGRSYEEPTLVLFRDAVQSACGLAGAAVGPFYCPLDHKLYIDLSFYDDLRGRFGAPGDFAQAYVIAHEVGHHVQTLLGITEKLQAARQRGGAEANAISVRFELQADCLSGVWAHHAHRARQVLEQGDVEEGLAAAAAIGDDRLQRKAGGQVVPESFTHGTSEQRVRWFRRGLEAGDLDRCNTFGAEAV